MVNRRRILYLAASSRWNGTGKYVQELALYAVRLNFDVAVSGARHGALIERLGALDIPYFEMRSFWSVLAILFRFRPHILHTADPRSAVIGGLAFLVYRIVFLRFDSANIHTVRGWTFTEPRGRLNRMLRKAAERMRCLLCDTIILLSRADHQTALEYRIAPKRKLTVVPPGIDPRGVAVLARDEARAKLLETEFRDRIVIGTIGEFIRIKGHRYLLEAFASLKYAFHERDPRRAPLLHLLLIGTGGAFEELRRKAEILKIENDITFVANAASASPYCSAFDIFVLPSLAGASSYTLLEAALAKLPVIATDVGGNPDIIKHDKTGLLIPPRNAGKIAAGIERLIANPEFACRLGSGLHEHVVKNFALSESLSKTFTLY
ncbi:MAG: glycosyltransferase [Candidatus Niyogibacteria bacterium]|nr:glycosyltransferase [Candidatus Niyogibacteria bacterium]